MRHCKAVLAAGIGCLAFAALAEPKRAVVSYSSVVPVLDGDIDGDQAWKSQPWNGGFVLLRKTVPPKEGTRFKALYTDDALYIAVECRESDVAAMKFEERPEEFWIYDVTELFFAPNADELIHPGCSAGGNRNQQIGGATLTRTHGQIAWDAKARKDKDRWTVEYLLPLYLLGVNPARGAVELPFNICRSETPHKEYSTWNATEQFGFASGFGRLAFAPPPAAARERVDRLATTPHALALAEKWAAVKKDPFWRETLAAASDTVRWLDAQAAKPALGGDTLGFNERLAALDARKTASENAHRRRLADCFFGGQPSVVWRQADGDRLNGRLMGEAKSVPTPFGTGVHLPGKMDSLMACAPATNVLGSASFSLWTTLARRPDPAAEGKFRNFGFFDIDGFGRLTLDAGGSLTVQFSVPAEPGDLRDYIARAEVGKTFVPGDWVHVAGVYSQTRKQAEIWVNGTLLGVRPNDVKARVAMPSLDGSRGRGGRIGQLPPAPLAGTVAALRIYNGELDGERIAVLESANVRKLLAQIRRELVGYGAEADALRARLDAAAKDGTRLLSDLGQLQQAVRALRADREVFGDREVLVTAVPPFEKGLYLPDRTLAKESLGKPLELTLAPGERASASFVVRARTARKDVLPVLSPLTPEGRGLRLWRKDLNPEAVCDLRILKTMAKPADAARVGGRMIGTGMLVHDDDILRTDSATMENTLRLSFADRTEYAPMSFVDQVWHANYYCDAAKHPVRDAAKLKPVTVKAGETRQYFATFKLPSDTSAGTYRGTLSVAGEKLPVVLRVLPFALPEPKTRYDLTRPYRGGVYFRFHGLDLRADSAGSLTPNGFNEAQFRAQLRNVKAHGVTVVGTVMNLPLARWDGKAVVRATDEDRAYVARVIAILREEGMLTRPFFFYGGGNPGFRARYDRTKHAAAMKEIWDDVRATLVPLLGHDEIVVYGVDEADGKALESEFAFWEDFRRLGGRVFVTTLTTNVARVAPRIDVVIASSAPARKTAETAHASGARIWNYAWPQVEREMDPLEYRRNYGFGCYAANYDGFDFYAYIEAMGHPWNPFDSRLGWDGLMVYPTADGVLDVPAWEAMGAAVDDVRYATKLLEELEKVKAKGQGEDMAAEAKAFLESIDVSKPGFSPAATRATIVDYILKLTERK